MGKVKIVCVCGSTRFCKEIAVYKWELEKQGIMAIGLHLLVPFPGCTVKLFLL